MAGATPEQLTLEAAFEYDEKTARDDDAAFQELDSLSLKEILDQDSRPTLVLDLDPDYVFGDKRAIRPIFSNFALRQHHQLLDNVTGTPDEDGKSDDDAKSYLKFYDWATGVSRFNDAKEIFPITFQYRNLLWTASTIRQRWRIISGNALFQTSDIPRGDLMSAPLSKSKRGRNHSMLKNPAQAHPREVVVENVLKETPVLLPSETPSITLSKNTSKDTSGTSSSVTLATPNNIVPDWTVSDPRGGILPDHIKFVRKMDWSNTPLGPMHKWSVQFRELVNLLMRNPHPAALFWGEELTVGAFPCQFCSLLMSADDLQRSLQE